MIAEGEPARVDRVGGVRRGNECCALAPAVGGLAANAQQERFLDRHAPVRGAERFDERTAEYVAAANTSVPPAVASDEIVAQSANQDKQ